MRHERSQQQRDVNAGTCVDTLSEVFHPGRLLVGKLMLPVDTISGTNAVILREGRLWRLRMSNHSS